MKRLLAMWWSSPASFDRFVRVEVDAMRISETLHAFERIGPAGEAPARPVSRRHQPVLRGHASMHRLAHGAEHRLQAGRLRRRDPASHGCPIGVEFHQPAAGRRRADASNRRGGMETVAIVAGAHQRARPAGHFVARDEGCEMSSCDAPISSASATQPRQQRNRRMAEDRHVHVVIVDGMGRRAVDQRRVERRSRSSHHRQAMRRARAPSDEDFFRRGCRPPARKSRGS